MDGLSYSTYEMRTRAVEAVLAGMPIVSVADAYHAMTSDRSYRKALKREEAVAELKKNRGSQFNPMVVDTFLKILEEENKTV